MSTFICTNTLPSNLLTADPTQKLSLHFSQLDLSQLFKGQLVLAPRTEYSFDFWFNQLYMLDMGRGVFEAPEGCFHIVTLFSVELVYADRFHIFLSDGCLCSGWLLSSGKFSSLGDLSEEVISLKSIQTGHFFLNLLLALSQFLPLLKLFHLRLMLSYALFLLDQILNHASSTE